MTRQKSGTPGTKGLDEKERDVTGARNNADDAPQTGAQSGPEPETEAEAALIAFDDFMKVDIRVGTIIEALEFPEARKPAFKLKIDFGPQIGIRKSSAQITANYTLSDLVGRQVCAVVNFPPRQIGPLMSQVLTLGMPDATGEVTLISPGHKVPNGGRLY